MADEQIRTNEPHDRLTRLCDAMINTLDGHPEHRDEKCVVFLQDEERGGLVLHGYEDDSDAIVDVLLHLRALLRSRGKELIIAPLGGDG